MATYLCQSANGNINDANKWSSDGGGTFLTWGAHGENLVNGDILDFSGKDNVTCNTDIYPASGKITLQNTGASGPTFYSLVLTTAVGTAHRIDADLIAGPNNHLLRIINNNSGTVTINGKSTGSVSNNYAGIVLGGAGGGVTINDTVTGGSGGTSTFGVYMNSGNSVLVVNGDPVGSAGEAINAASAGSGATITITPAVSVRPGGARAAVAVGGNTCTITGLIVAGGTSNLYSGVTVAGGGTLYHNGAVTNLSNGVQAVSVAVGGKYIFTSTDKTITRTLYDAAGNPITFYQRSADATAANIIKDKVIDGITGTFDEAARNTDPGEANVWTGTSYKIANSSFTGTKRASSITNCSAGNVKAGVAIDDVTGTLPISVGVNRNPLISCGA